MEKTFRLLELYREKRKVDGLNGRTWDAPRHWVLDNKIQWVEERWGRHLTSQSSGGDDAEAVHCKRCKKVFEVFFCPECTEVSVEILAQMMEKKLESSKAPGVCACKSGGWFDFNDICITCGGTKPPPA